MRNETCPAAIITVAGIGAQADIPSEGVVIYRNRWPWGESRLPAIHLTELDQSSFTVGDPAVGVLTVFFSFCGALPTVCPKPSQRSGSGHYSSGSGAL